MVELKVYSLIDGIHNYCIWYIAVKGDNRKFTNIAEFDNVRCY